VHADTSICPARRAAIFVIEIDDVFEARIASALRDSPRLLKTREA